MTKGVGMTKLKMLLFGFSMSIFSAFSDGIPNLMILERHGDDTNSVTIQSCTSVKKTEKTGASGKNRVITENYSISFPRTFASCKVLHVVKSFGDFTTTVNGDEGSRPTFVYAGAVKTTVKKDPSLYLFSTDEKENDYVITLKPLAERESYAYHKISNGRGKGRPIKSGYSHSGFIVFVTWHSGTKQVFSDITELRNKRVGLTDYIASLKLVNAESDRSAPSIEVQ